MEIKLERRYLFIFAFIVVFMVGAVAGIKAYEFSLSEGSYSTVGFYLIDSTNEDIENLVSYKKHYQGDWLCVDIEEMYDYEYIVEVCSHEVAHHIYESESLKNTREQSEDFAYMCESNISRCLDMDWELMRDLNNGINEGFAQWD